MLNTRKLKVPNIYHAKNGSHEDHETVHDSRRMKDVWILFSLAAEEEMPRETDGGKFVSGMNGPHYRYSISMKSHVCLIKYQIIMRKYGVKYVFCCWCCWESMWEIERREWRRSRTMEKQWTRQSNI